MKQELRKKFIKLRSKKYFELTESQVSIVVSFLSSVIKSHKIKTIGAYQPINHELNINPVLQILKKKWIIALPVVLKNNKMEFRTWNEH